MIIILNQEINVVSEVIITNEEKRTIEIESSIATFFGLMNDGVKPS